MRSLLAFFCSLLLANGWGAEFDHYDVVGYKEDARMITVLVSPKPRGQEKKFLTIEVPFAGLGQSAQTRSTMNVIHGAFSQGIADEKLERNDGGFIVDPLYGLHFSVPKGQLGRAELWAFGPVFVDFENVRKYVAKNPVFAKP